MRQVATEWLYSVPEHVLEKHLGNEPSTPTSEAEQQLEDSRRSLVPRRVPLQVRVWSAGVCSGRGRCPCRADWQVVSVGLQAVRSIAAGGQHTVAVTDSNVFAWGSNSCGQLGTRTFRDKAVPTEVRDLASKGVVQVACGLEHTLVLCGYACCL